TERVLISDALAGDRKIVLVLVGDEVPLAVVMEIGVELILEMRPAVDRGDRERHLPGIASLLANASGAGAGGRGGDGAFFDKGDMSALAGELPGDGSADDASADDEYI